MAKRAPAARPLPDLLTWITGESMLFTDERSPFRARLSPGSPELVLIGGENAGGKSLLFRVLCQKIRPVVPITISIRERTGAGDPGMSRMRQAMMFGDETDSSTGAISARVVQAGFRNLDRDGGSLLGLDEPEIGLSDSYARALGELIGRQTRQIPTVCAGVVVVTHSRSLVRGLRDGYGASPTFVHVGADDDGEPVDRDLDGWLKEPEHRSVQDLMALPDLAHQRFLAAHRLLKP